MSGTVAGSLIFDTKTDLSGFNRGIKEIDSNFKKVSQEVANTGEKIEKKLKEPINKVTKEVSELDKAFQKLGAVIVSVFSVQKIAQFGQEALNIASDLNEVQNVVDTTFQNSAREIDRFAETALEKFGLSELSAKQFASTIGTMFKSMGLGNKDILEMSKVLTGLSGDMASFYNLEPEVAFEKLRAGISGETEPLKQLGINLSVVNLEAFAMSEGIKKAYNSMTQAEQATLRYRYILQATADAQGDFAKTYDTSYANQTKALKENMATLTGTIGDLFLPVAIEVVSILNKITIGITDLVEAAGDGNIVAIAMIAVVTTLIGLFTFYAIKLVLANTLTGIWTTISGAATLTTSALAAAFTFLTGPIGLVIIAITALIGTIVLVVKHWEEIKTTAIEVWASIQKTWSNVKSWFNKTFVDPIKEGINKMLSFAEGLANGFVNAANQVIKALNKISFTIPDWVPDIGGETFGINIKELSRVSIPKLATGAVIPPNSEFLAILGDQKHGTNIEAPLSTIEQAVDNVLSRRGYSGGGAPIIIQLDGREVARVIAPYNAGESARQGVRLIDGVI